MSMTLKEYWVALQESIKKFDENNTIRSINAADNKSYQQQRTFLVEVANLGLELENASLLFKARLAAELEAFPEETFGDAQIVTKFGGALSVAFAQQVYLPHVQRFAEVTLENQNIVVQGLVDLPKKKIATKVLAKQLEDTIASYKALSTTPLTLLTVFAVTKKADTASEQPSSGNQAVK